ncbi:MAG: DUF2934 domain-containing protein [Chitinivibrionales bacterium]|nr:DUF2934 domain-containing protein [Chitinivibrionales bacterium]
MVVTIKKRIEKRAYQLFQQRDCNHGNDMDDWLSAEKEIVSFEIFQSDRKSVRKHKFSKEFVKTLEKAKYR